MRPRTLLPLVILAVVVTIVVVFPGTPLVRDAVVARAVAIAADAGYHVAAGATRGNLWTGVTLLDVEVAGPGIRATASAAEVRYFLPPLLTGELPVDVALADLEGTVDVTALTDALAARAPGAAQPSPLRMRLQDLSVMRSNLVLADVPFTLPDARVEEIEGRSVAQRVEATFRIVTAEGAADVRLIMAAASGTLVLDVLEANARLGRHWWDGVEEGSVSGQIRIGDTGVAADLEVRDAVIQALGTRVETINGPVRWRGALIEATLSGRALGGELTASGGVDAADLRWFADGVAEGAALDAVTEWLWSYLGAPGAPIASSGAASARVSAEGWERVRVAVEARAEGEALGEPLSGAHVHVDYDGTRVGTTVDAAATWAGGDLDVGIDSAGGATTVAATLRNARPLGVTVTELKADLTLGEVQVGDARLTGAWDAPFGSVALAADLSLDGDGASLYLHADGGEVVAEGAVVLPALTPDARLDGGITITTPDSWWVSGTAPATGVRLEGRLDRPRLTLGITDEAPAVPRVAGASLDIDVRGAGSATADDVGWRVDGAFGPLSVDGGWGGARAIRLGLDAVGTTGAVRAALGDLEAIVRPGTGGWQLEASADVGPITVAPAAGAATGIATIEPLGTVTLVADPSGGHLSDAAGRLDLLLDGQDRALALREVRATVVDLPVTVTADLSATAFTAWAGAARLDGAGLLAEARLDADGGVDFVARLAAGGVLGGWRPASEVTVEARGREGSFDLRAGAGRLELRARADASGIAGTLHEDGDERGSLRLDDSGWRLEAEVELAPALEIAGVAPEHARDVVGTLEVDVAAASGRGAAGTVTARVERPLAAEVEITVADGEATLVAGTRLAGLELDGRGRAWPEPDLVVAVGDLGALRVTATGAEGTGRWEGLDAGWVRIAPQAWSLAADPGAARADLSIGDSELSLTWHEGLQATARVAQDVALAGVVVRLSGDAGWSEDAPDGHLALKLDSDDPHLSASLDGDLRHAQLHTTTPIHTITDALGLDLPLAGTLDATATLALLDASANATVRWRTDHATLDATATLADGTWRIDLTAPGLHTTIDPDGTHLTATAFDPDPFLTTPTGARLDADLRHHHGTWHGTATTTLTTPTPATATLTGAGDHLTITARTTSDDLPTHLTLHGTITPTPDGPTATGTLHADAGTLGPLTWPQLDAAWTYHDTTATLTSEHGSVRLTPAGITGAWSHPLAVAGQAHILHAASDRPTTTLSLIPASEMGVDASLVLTTVPEGWRWTARGHTMRGVASIDVVLEGIASVHDDGSGTRAIATDLAGDVALAGVVVRLSGDAGWSEDAPDGHLALKLDSDDPHLSASLDGDLRHAQLHTTTPIHTITDALGLDLPLAGTLDATATLALLDASANATVRWRTDHATLDATATLADGTWRIDLTAPGLHTTIDPDGTHLTATAFDPDPFLTTPTGARLDADLRHHHGTWHGTATTTLTTPTPATATLTGAGDHLTITARTTSDDLPTHLTLHGTITPTPDGPTATGTLHADAGTLGPLTWPQLDAAWTYHDTTATLTSEHGLAARLTLAEGAWRWGVDAGGMLDATPVRAELVGTGVTGSGTVTVGEATSPVARMLLAVDDGALTATLDDAGVDLAPLASVGGVALTGRLAGDLVLRLGAGGFGLDAALAGDVTVAGTALEAAFTSRGEGPWSLTVREPTGVWAVRGSLERAAALAGPGVAVTVEGPALVLRGRVAYDGGLVTARLAGTASERALGVSGHVSGGVGAVALTWGASTLELDLAGDAAALRAHAAASEAPAGPWSLAAEFRRTERWEAERVALRGAGGEVEAELAGTLTPVDLRGSLRALGATRSLGVTTTDDGVRLTVDALTVLATLERGIVVSGAVDLPTGVGPASLIVDDLGWHPDHGFSGRASAGLDVDVVDAALAATVTGDGDLHLTGGATVAGTEVGQLVAVVRQGDLEGRVELDLPLGHAGADAWRLAATGPISGTWSAPVLDASLALSGLVTAHGGVRLAADTARADLVGEGIVASIRRAQGGWHGQVRLTDLDVSAFLPPVAPPRLDLVADARSGPNGVEVYVDEIRLTAGDSTVSGQGRIARGTGVLLTLRSDIDLSDLRLATPLGGRLHGPVMVRHQLGDPWSNAELSAVLAAVDVRSDALPGRLSGDVQLSGAILDPHLRTTLRAGGDASGSLRADLRLRRGAGRIDADLDLGPLRADLAVLLSDGAIAADGRVAVDGYAVTLTSADDGTVTWRGEGRLGGWDGRIATAPWTVDVRADLDVATPLLGGALTLRGSWPERSGAWPRVEGAFAALSLGPVLLGDLELGGDGDGRYRARGATTTATLDAASGSWTIDVAGGELRLGTGQMRLDLDAAGSAAGVTASARLYGRWLGDEAHLSAQLDWTDAPRLAGSGALLGGQLRFDVARDATLGWQGDGVMVGAALAGQTLEARAAVSGTTERPTVLADARLGADRVIASLRWEGDVVHTDTTLTLPSVSSLRVGGALWPLLDLELAADGGEATARVHGPWAGPGALRWEGDVELEAPGVRAALVGGADGAASLFVTSPWLRDASARAELPQLPLLETLEVVATEGLAFELGGDAAGTARVAPDGATWKLDLGGVVIALGGARAELDGAAELGGLGAFDVLVALPEGAADVSIRGLPTEPVRGRLEVDGTALRLQTEPPWRLEAALDLASGTGSVASDVTWRTADGPAAVRGAVSLDPAAGLVGALEVSGVAIGRGESTVRDLRLGGRIAGEGNAARVTASVAARRSALSLSGVLPLTVPGLAAVTGDGAPPARQLDVRVASLDVGDLPWLADHVPHVAGVISGSLALRGEQLIGQLVAPELRAAETALPATLTLAGDADRIDLRLELGPRRNGVVTASWAGGALDVLARLEAFPLHAPVEAVVGPTDVSAVVTGAVRAGWHPFDDDPLDLRVATEHVRLERAGVVTTGTAAFELADGALVIGDATFTGRGSWRASGEIRPERLDLELVAVDADFGPLLGLVPSFARYGVGAEGDLEVVGRGSLTEPTLHVRSGGLRLTVAGTSYEVASLDAGLTGERLALEGVLRGVAPLGGEVRVEGDGVLRLLPFELASADVTARGSIDVPVVGRLEEVDASIGARAGATPSLTVDALLGAPIRIAGDLAPLDVRVTGTGLELAVPQVFVDHAVADAELRVRVDDGVIISGGINAREARLALAGRGAAAGSQPVARDPAEVAARRAAQQLVRFDSVRITAPQRVMLTETIGTAEASVNLTLTGDVADPRLEGSVNALRGTFRFSGRDFELLRAVALFEPPRGVLPRLDIEARTSFEKARVAPPGSDVRFAAPPGPRFDVVLRFEADVTTTGPGGAVNLDLVPQVSSDALVEVGAGPEGITAGTRGLTELELLSLIALGRLEVGTAGTGDVASTFAQRALDTAVDLLVVAELQAALSEALGIDVVEIRTTALSDILGGATDPFSVSLRFGGYVSDELFASYRVGTFDDAERAFAVTSELALTYELGPVAFDLSGRLDVPSAAATATAPAPAIAASVRYDVSRWFAVEAGVDIGTIRQTARFGVTIRW
jgi:hypothetical protein